MGSNVCARRYPRTVEGVRQSRARERIGCVNRRRIVSNCPITCKCVRSGYRPWDEQPGGAPLRALHQACIHMMRADYGGEDDLAIVYQDFLRSG